MIPHICSTTLLLLFLAASIVSAAEPPPESRTTPPRMLATRAAGPIALDGRLDEPDWQRAAPARGFLQVDPRSGEPATRDTEVRVLFDGAALYLGVTCFDKAGLAGVRVPDLRRDFDEAEHDLFGVSFDPFLDGRTAQAFLVNPWGAQRDLLVADDSNEDIDWDAPWSVRTEVGASGWTAEIAIPWSTLRYPPGSGEESGAWGIQFVRRVRRIEEVSGWSPWPRGLTPFRMTYAGRIDGLVPPPPARQIRLQPYVLTRASRLDEAGLSREEEDFEAGGEMKWLPSPSTAVDLTVNTDFAQTDADRQVVNLSRFSVLFPERRQFFLESASLFDSGFDALKPFFSRRIGLDDLGQPVPIDAGLRIVHQDAARRWGGLVARTASEGSVPASTFAVARLSENLGRRHRLGTMLVGRRDEAGPGQAEQSNGVLVLDGLFRPHELFTVQGFVSASSTSRAGGDGTAGSLWVYTRGPRGYLGWIERWVSEDYEASAGFVSRRNLLLTSPAGTLDWRPAWLPAQVRQLKPNFVANFYHSFEERDFQEGNLRLEPLWIVFQDGSEVWSWWEPNWQRLDQPFSPLPGLEVAPGDYDYDRWGLAGATDRSRAYGLEIRHVTGGFFDGRLDTTNVTARLRPSPRLSLVVDFQRDALRDIGPDEKDRTSELVAPELRLAWSPRLQLTAFYQYNTAAELASWYARLAWEIAPLSYLYLVYGDTEPTEAGSGFLTRSQARDRRLAFKLTYLWQR